MLMEKYFFKMSIHMLGGCFGREYGDYSLHLQEVGTIIFKR